MNICASACFSKNRKLEEVQQYLISSIDKDIQEEIDKIGSELDQSVSEFVDLIGNQFPGYCVLTGNIIQPLKDKVSEINFREFSNYDAFLVAFLAEEDDI
ncbi:hypothetical protein SS50377_20994 [Spironucleus salmonicida]|uniref:Uncharacterized protein n=1 Tax=Spironucleus salmonicida TaxID=348837 RepID=V6LJ10_9EUKA|nr:hypothetical protein SS50377_20994 [Spironucleus salmonicida]|eukprot:EST43661.1 Hypothetical protein SS50377_16704 [Spironucleus salmonicida]